ncbi:helix-turn-helix domain-containing protein [Nocardia macrotermitis]|uniref:helix-turn-helix domain-containing protein n=1 Tax=Nocardia macrotermitis TaxID=2585198 RepID=UPI00129687DD
MPTGYPLGRIGHGPQWRKRFCCNGIDRLTDLPRSGRPRTFTPGQVAQVKALACELPAWTGLRFTAARGHARW